jgi:hypothetical protein
MSPVVLEAPPKPLSWLEELTAPAPLSFHEVGCAYPSGRSVGVSFLLHQLVLLLVVLSSRYAFVQTVKNVPPNFETAVPENLPAVAGRRKRGQQRRRIR